MLAKLRLNHTDDYEKLVAADYVAKMLVSFVCGDEHVVEIGGEQGGIAKWDDFVIRERTKQTHLQIKRQTTDFGNGKDECLRSEKRNSTEQRGLSVLDEAIESLGRWLDTDNSEALPRRFRLIFPDGEIAIKKGFKVKNLNDIIAIHIRQDVTTVEGVRSLCSEDGHMENCRKWLTTWCGIKNDENILSILKALDIEYTNSESSLKERAIDTLKRVFKGEDVEEIYEKISFYIKKNTTYTGSIRPRHLLSELANHLKSDTKRWTRFYWSGRSWDISGINDIASNKSIEAPSVVVPALWTDNNSYVRELKVFGSGYSGKCDITGSLIRLSLHPVGVMHVDCLDKTEWVNRAGKSTGGTLGLGEEDLSGLRIIQSSEGAPEGENRSLKKIGEIEAFAKELHEKMHNLTFGLVDGAITEKIRKSKAGNLRSKVEDRWGLWRETLDYDSENQGALFSRILGPAAEGKRISAENRVGPKTVSLLRDAIYHLLVVSVCLSDDDHINSWDSVRYDLNMVAFGLAYWSGSADNDEVVEIDDESHVSQLLESEKNGQIIILSQSTRTNTEIFEDDISGNLDKVANMTQPRYPQLLITNHSIFRKLLKQGDLEKISEYIKGELKRHRSEISTGVEGVAVG
ncbi:MAG: hypothetical protein COA42_18625 [Alteromonadaceae bacterium]|nr:MAG: hypothetical protein COA42_18625 [Alteromonadaceae bacterium]